jgi:EPS-associated MarR family transcriptional regulator
MNKKINQDEFNVLRKIKKETQASQRILAKELNFSLGKLNYVLKELKKKGLIKINSFKQKPSKIYYALTPRGISQRTYLTLNFMKKKMREYDELKNELNERDHVDSNQI